MTFFSHRRQRAPLLVLAVIVLFIWSTSTFYVGNKATDIMVHQTNDIRELEQAISTTAENLKSYNHNDNQHVHNPDQRESPHVTDQTQDQTQHLPLIYVITPTVYRPEQKADLTRTSHTLKLVPRIHWIVIEDREKRSKRVAKFLKRSQVPYTHLAEQTDLLDIAMLKIKDQLKLGWEMPKGVQQRNTALQWIRNHGEYPSVFYFGDDDNTYDLQLFEEMRYTRRVSVWPVGLIGMAMFQTPVVNNGKVIGWAAGWIFNRTFPIDMAGFAVNSDVLKRDDPPIFSMEIGKGFIETNFLEQLNVTIDELEPRADNCTQVLVWHTKTEKSPMDNNLKLKSRLKAYESLAEFLHLTEKLYRGKGGSVAVSVLKELSNVKKLPYACIQDLFTSLREAAFVYQPSTTIQPDNSKTCLFKQTAVDEWSKQKAELKKLIKQHMDPVVNLKECQKKCWQSKVKMNEYASMLEAAQLSLPYNSDDPNEYKARVLAIKGLKKDLSSKQRRHTRNLTAYGELLEMESKIRIDIVEIAESLRCRITERITEKLQEALNRLQAVSALPVHFDPALISASVYDLTSRVYMFDEPTTEVSSVAIMRPLTMESQYNFADDQNTYAPYDYTGTVKEQCVEYTEDYLKLKEGDSVKLKMIARGGRTGFGWTKPSRFSTKRWGFFPVTKVAIDYHTSNR